MKPASQAAGVEASTIVAEVSKNWICGEPHQAPLLSEMFERVIGVNRERGFALRDWRLNQLFYDAGRPTITETIIAIFERELVETRIGGSA